MNSIARPVQIGLFVSRMRPYPFAVGIVPRLADEPLRQREAVCATFA